jgi:hypothetical protein
MHRPFAAGEVREKCDGAYREVERLAGAAGVGPADEAKKRADRIEERLGER